MAMTDVPVAGMWFFCLAIFIDSEKEPINHRLSVLLGGGVGLIFLTKFTFIYMTGLIGWFLIRDRNFARISNFAIGWFVICLPFLVNQFLKYRNPFHAISGKVSYAKESSYRNVGTYDAVTFAKTGSQIIGGKGGGGRKDFAQAGGQFKDKIDEAFEKSKTLI